MILCSKCGKKIPVSTEASFDYWSWFDATEDFHDPHGRFCNCCGTEFADGETVILTDADM